MDIQKLLRRKKKAICEGNKVNLVLVSADLAQFYSENGQLSLAIEEYKVIADIHKDEGRWIDYAQANRGMGEAFLGLNKYERALEHLQVYLDVAKEENNELETQRALATIGHAFLTQFLNCPNENNKKSLTQANKFLLKSLTICESLNGISKLERADMLARLFSNLGVIQECLGHNEKATELLTRSINICKKYDIYEQLYRGYLSMASLLEKKQEYNESIHQYNLAFEVAKKLKGKTELLCGALIPKADVLIKLGDYHGAKQVLIKAYKTRTSNIEDMHTIEGNLRVVAVMCLTEDRLVMNSGDNKELKKLYEKMGDGASELKNYDKAVEYYKMMLEAAERSGASSRELGVCYYSIAETYKDSGQFEKSLKYYEMEYNTCKENLADSLNTLSKIADTKEMAGALLDDVRVVYEKAFEKCRLHKNLEEERRMVLRFIAYLKRHHHYLEVSHMEEHLSKQLELDPAAADLSSSDTENEDCDGRTDTAIGADICLDDITDLSEESDGDNENVKNDEVGRRRRSKNYSVKRNLKGETPLHTACIAGNIAVVRHLIEQGHPINIRDNCGWLPLHEACICGHLEIVTLLVDRGAAINDRGGTHCGGVTPLHDAACNGHLHVIELLLNRGASAVAKTDSGETPLNMLQKWGEGMQLDGQQREFYDRLMKEMSEILHKAGQDNSPLHTAAVSVTPLIQKTTRKTAATKTKIQGIDLTDDRNISDDSVCTSEDEAVNEYQQVMGSLRKLPQKQQMQVISPNDEAPFVEDMLCDDWLDDDLGDKHKKRKIDKKESTSSICHKIKASNKYNSFNTYSTTTSNATNINLSVANEVSDDAELQFISDNFISANAGSSSAQNTSKSSGCFSKKRKRQISLLDSGFSRSKSVTPPLPVGSAVDSSILENVDLRIKGNSAGVAQPMAEPDSTSAVSPKINRAVADPMLFVDVRIEGRLFRVPLMFSQLHSHTIKWLAEEAANRYARKECRKPSLELETSNGAVLADEDTLNLLFPKGELQAEQIEGRVVRWTQQPLTDRYKEACSLMNTDSIDYLCEFTKEVSTNVNLSNQCLMAENLAPLLKAINYQSSLLELDLTGNLLNSECVNLLCTSLLSLENVKVLNLKCCGLEDDHLAYFTNLFSKNSTQPPLQKLASLNLSCNFLTNASLPQLSKLVEHLKLTSFDLSSMNFANDLFDNPADNMNASLNLIYLEQFYLSNNKLNEAAIARFVSFTMPSTLKVLDVSRNSTDKSVLKSLLDGNCNSVFTRLENLNLSRCNIQDHELFNLLRCSPSLMHLDLSHNIDLTGITLRRLMENTSLKSVNLIGCDNIIKHLQDCTPENLIFEKTSKLKILKLSLDPIQNKIQHDSLIKLFSNVHENILVESMDSYLHISVI